MSSPLLLIMQKLAESLPGATSGHGADMPSRATSIGSEGDDYCGDPSQEAQGLNSVFVVDKSTMKVVKEAIKNINKITK